jgi:endonuclease/exonuclease/phosphatase family metal-dependent hydrolase
VSAARPLLVASYNVHGWVGTDGRYDPDRVGRVIEEMRPDLLALQEVRCHGEEPSPLDLLAAERGAEVVRGVTLQLGLGTHGNAVLSRLPLDRIGRDDLSVPGREPRGLIDVTTTLRGETLRVVATHLGIGPWERRIQVQRLVVRLAELPAGTLVLLGDMNEWARGVGALHPLHRLLGRTPGPRTFPSQLPVFSLDRIWVAPRQQLRRLWVHRSPLARRASDHLPVLAELDLGRGTREGEAPARGLLRRRRGA